MTRRRFIRKLAQICSFIVAGACTFTQRASAQTAKLRKFVRAARAKEYPGTVKPLQDIRQPSKWSG